MVVLLVLGWLTGCATTAKTPGANYRPAIPPVVRTPPPTTGSIYQSGYEIRLFEDIKARRVGDVLTVMLQERTQASKSATTETSKETDVTLANPTILGRSPSFDVPIIGSDSGHSLATGVDSTHEFTGEGDSSQSNSLTGNITVTISEVLPNGNLVVRGEKWLTLNQGEEFIQISGIVRPQDISPQNTVVSTQVADARITYSGEGVIADSQQVGWLGRFFMSVVWPF